MQTPQPESTLSAGVRGAREDAQVRKPPRGSGAGGTARAGAGVKAAPVRGRDPRVGRNTVVAKRPLKVAWKDGAVLQNSARETWLCARGAVRSGHACGDIRYALSSLQG